MAEENGQSFQNVTEPSDSNRKNDSITRDEDLEDIKKYKYKMDYPEKGVCVIINIEKLTPELISKEKLPTGDRPGTNKDVEALSEVFKSFGFQVRIENNATAEKIIEVMEKVAKEDHSQRGCFVCVVLSHGKEGGFYCTDDFMEEEYLFNLFKGESCKQLVGKPKLFFIQACRGRKVDRGVTPYASEAITSTGKIPIEADFLCHYSTSQGYVAFRDTSYGSWFIQSLCDMLTKYGKKYELMQILTRVNHKVAFEYGTCVKKEMPCIVSKLTKDIYL
ncbi:caspase-3-like [Lithobates pipiens]